MPATIEAQRKSCIREDLLRPEAYATVVRSSAVTLIETHISWVFLLDENVFKVKKPVDLGFLDFRSRDGRRRACEEEVRLNARLAPGVYRGVIPITCGADGRCVLGGTETPVDWAVHMLRLPDDERADRLLAEGRLSSDCVDRIATRIAAFHATARSDHEVARFGRPAAIEHNVVENFEQTRDVLPRYLGASEREEIARWQLGFLREQSSRFDARMAQGRIVDGHGDLRLEHVYRDAGGRIRVLDCIEFNERFRYADACADIAFLSMDLGAHGRMDLAERLLATYARQADDYDLYSVVDFYASYRAFVRGKVASMLADDSGASDDTRCHAEADARRFFRLALAFERAPVVAPCVIAVGGVIASGKSSVADRLALALSGPVLDADRTRKAMLGVEPLRRLDDGPWQGAYDPVVSSRVYEEILRRAGVVLSSGRPVILDASFRSAGSRRAARELARAHGVAFRFVECLAARDVCLARLAEREHTPNVSDGRRAIFDAFCARYEPVGDEVAADHLPIQTARPLDENVEAVRRSVEAWPSGL
ncbi:MAG: AAA family ATPase [Polyangiaceae bacterium]|nr:AAA family ATPase [Polyangiaceae bacterium]